MRGGRSQEVLGVDDAALLGFGNDLVGAAGDIPDPPAPFTVTGGDAISQQISSLLPEIEGTILTGLPQVKEEAKSTADRIVSAAQTYQRVDEQIAQTISGTELGDAGGSGLAGAGAGGGGAGGGGAGGGGAAESGVRSAAAMAGSSSGGAGYGSGSGAMGQMLSTPMQMASQAAQIPTQAMGAVASAPQTVMQGVQQIAQIAGGTGDDADKPAAEHKPSNEVVAERPTGERAPVQTPASQNRSATGETSV